MLQAALCESFHVHILLTSLLQGYRSCLTLVRIHLEPIISFHKAAFLSLRSSNVSVQDAGNFLPRFLDCMFFNELVHNHGPPWRKCDIFDELYSSIQALAKQLYDNENQAAVGAQRIPLPMEGHMMRVHQPVFPTLDTGMVTRIIEENQNSAASNNFHSSCSVQSQSNHTNKLVPLGPSLPGDTGLLVTNSAQRLKVLRNCIGNIFENKIIDAKKTFPAVIRALKSKAARLAL